MFKNNLYGKKCLIFIECYVRITKCMNHKVILLVSAFAEAKSPKGGVNMNKYELAVIFNPTLDEESLKNEFESVKSLLERFNASIDKVDDWGKRRLAYEINKVNEGYYYFINFNADSNVPSEIESRMRIKENVLRYLVVRQEA